ncbi:hypothetical protein Tco_0683038 [Tanacetum coccineum]|uniref:Reverse transcriptase domain-containing protein n=1 Tax=Tanacetum coccineum TaxID=301880 RepID=A0ABQ4XSX6_9ASTR
MMFVELLDIITSFAVFFWWKELSKESSSKILPCGDGSCWKTLKSVERASVFHQPDGVGSKRYHVVPYGELNGIPIALVARFRCVNQIQIQSLLINKQHLRLPEELNGVHDTFYVSNLKNCLADPTLQIPLDEIQVDSKLNFVEELVEILERERVQET